VLATPFSLHCAETATTLRQAACWILSDVEIFDLPGHVRVRHNALDLPANREKLGCGTTVGFDLSRQLRSLGDNSWLVCTNIPSVLGQRETNDTDLAATTHNRA
jgi:hypothetical protein